MPKLHLKRTPEEEAMRRLRKQEKKRRKRCYEYENTEPSGSTSSYKRPRMTEVPSEPERKWASSDEDEEQYGPQPTSSSRRRKSNQHEPTARTEEVRFQEKLFDAFADDERLDSLEARLNGYAHVPDRWRTEPLKARSGARFDVFEDDEWLKMDPQTMDEEEYTEWIRTGMYRKTHADEYAEHQRQKAAQASRRAEEKRKREETARLAKAAEEERKAKKRERDTQRWVNAWGTYHNKWKALSNSSNDTLQKEAEIGFTDIPWPVLGTRKKRSSHRSEETVAVTVEDLTVDAITAFLLPGGKPEGDRSKKEVLRETFLRFHPDKFEGRFMKTVRTEEQEVVREGIGRVVRALNTLMAE